MRIYKIVRYEILPRHRTQVEAAMRTFASEVQSELPGVMWATFREKRNPHRYVSLISVENATAEENYHLASSTHRFMDELVPHLVAEVVSTDYELVADSDRIGPPRLQKASLKRMPIL